MSWRSGQAYGQDLRDRVLGAEGSARQVAERFQVSRSYVTRVRARQRREGEATARRQGSRRISKLKAVEAALKTQVEAVQDWTLARLGDWLRSEHGVQVGTTTLWKTLARLGLTLKKSPCMPPNRIGRMSLPPGKPGEAGSRTWSPDA